MIPAQNQKIFLSISRIVFVILFFFLSFGFLIWEARGLVAWDSQSKKHEKTAKVQVVNPEGVVLAQGENEPEPTQSLAIVVSEDARPEIIRRYLAKYKSPLLPYSDLIFELSETYGYDYRWIVAIAQQESNLCKKIPEDSHNCWGYGIHKSGTLKFENYELALRSYAEYLKRVYFDKGLNTPETIMKKYCPSSNGSWAYGVSKFMEEMENGNF